MNKTYCFFSARYLPYLGGVERYTYNLANELILAGNKVIIVTSHIGKELAYEKKENVEIFRLPSLSLLKGRFPVIRYNRETKKYIKALKEKTIDFVIVNTRFYLMSYVGARFAHKNKISAIVIEHGTGHFTVNNRFFDSLGHIYEHFISIILKRNVKDYYGVSLECNKWLKHFKITAKGVLYNAINIEQIINLYEKRNQDIEKKIEYKSSDIVITFTGRLIKEKGVCKLLAAFKAIKEKFPDLKLCIAGDGNLYNEIVLEKEHGIYVLGKLSFENVVGLLKLSDIFCLPTDYPEGLPTSILEAVACKCYVITSAMGGAKELILDSTYGTVLQNNSVGELEKKLVEIISNRERREKAVKKSYEKICSEFTWKRTADKIIEIFEKNGGKDRLKNVE